jgi:hypothetical protein
MGLFLAESCVLNAADGGATSVPVLHLHRGFLSSLAD